MTDDNIKTLHSDDHAPTKIERELFERAWATLWKDEELPQSVLAAELVRLGVPTIERAVIVIEAHFAPGGLPPLDKGGKPSLQWLIQRHSDLVSTDELLRIIHKHHPGMPIADIVTELLRQAEANFAEADELIRYKATRRR